LFKSRLDLVYGLSVNNDYYFMIMTQMHQMRLNDVF